MIKQVLSLAAAAALTGFVGATNAGDLPPALGLASRQVLDAAAMPDVTGGAASAISSGSAFAQGSNSVTTTIIVNTSASVSGAGSAASASLFSQATAQ